PLDLPEIRVIIAQHLADDPPSLYACVSVCRAWHTDFIPQLWHTIRFDRHVSQHLTAEIFQQHERLVRVLFIHDSIFFGFFGSACANITRIVYRPHVATPNWGTSNYYPLEQDEEFENVDSDPESEPSNFALYNLDIKVTIRLKFLALIDQQVMLRDLHEDWTEFPLTLSTQFSTFHLRQLSRPSLVTLHITKWATTVTMLNLLVQESPCLEQLSLRKVRIVLQYQGMDTVPQPSKFDEFAPMAPIFSSSFDCVLDFQHVKDLRLEDVYLELERALICGACVESIEVTSMIHHAMREVAQDLVTREFAWNFPRTQYLKYKATGYNAPRALGPAISDILLSCYSSSDRLEHVKDSVEEGDSANEENSAERWDSRDHRFKELTLGNSDIPRSIISTVVTQFGDELEVLDLTHCGGLESQDIQLLLTHCGSLRIFRGPDRSFMATDMFLSSGDMPFWASTHFQELVLRVIILDDSQGDSVSALLMDVFLNISEDCTPGSKSTRRLMRGVFEQLSRQESLEVLDLSGDADYRFGEAHFLKGLPLVLNAGLDMLKGLKNLRRVVCGAWNKTLTNKLSSASKATMPTNISTPAKKQKVVADDISDISQRTQNAALFLRNDGHITADRLERNPQTFGHIAENIDKILDPSIDKASTIIHCDGLPSKIGSMD
ncbi:hypothetical protein BGZ65_004132, partial [Modicella reniformis]